MGYCILLNGFSPSKLNSGIVKSLIFTITYPFLSNEYKTASVSPFKFFNKVKLFNFEFFLSC